MFLILNTDSQIGSTITHLLKFVIVIYLYIYYASVVVLKSEVAQEKDIQAIFYINSIVLLLNIYSGLIMPTVKVWAAKVLYTHIIKYLDNV